MQLHGLLFLKTYLFQFAFLNLFYAAMLFHSKIAISLRLVQISQRFRFIQRLCGIFYSEKIISAIKVFKTSYELVAEVFLHELFVH